MTKQMYDRLVKYREPRKIESGELPLANAGYLKQASRSSPPLYVLSPNTLLEIENYEMAMQEQAMIDAHLTKVEKRLNTQNIILIVIAALTLIATVLGLLHRCP